jgi:hypothetical protein
MGDMTPDARPTNVGEGKPDSRNTLVRRAVKQFDTQI